MSFCHTRTFPQSRADSNTKIGMVGEVEMETSFAGSVSLDQQCRLLEMAGQMSHLSHGDFAGPDSNETPYSQLPSRRE